VVGSRHVRCHLRDRPPACRSRGRADACRDGRTGIGWGARAGLGGRARLIDQMERAARSARGRRHRGRDRGGKGREAHLGRGIRAPSPGEDAVSRPFAPRRGGGRGVGLLQLLRLGPDREAGRGVRQLVVTGSRPLPNTRTLEGLRPFLPRSVPRTLRRLRRTGANSTPVEGDRDGPREVHSARDCESEGMPATGTRAARTTQPPAFGRQMIPRIICGSPSLHATPRGWAGPNLLATILFESEPCPPLVRGQWRADSISP